MTSKPRVTASSTIEARTHHVACQPFAQTSPGVEIHVDFDLHDHNTAIARLDQAVADIKAQIEEVQA